MSLLLATGFDHSGLVDTAAGELFSPISAASVAVGHRYSYMTTGRYRYLSNGNSVMNFNIPPAQQHATIYVGLAYRQSVAPYTGNGTFGGFVRLISDALATTHLDVHWSNLSGPTGKIRVTRGGTEIGLSAAIDLANGAWHYFEMKAVIHDTTGEVVIHHDGDEVINVSSVDTKNGGTSAVIECVQFRNSADNTYGALDDVYILNGDGTAPNSRLGECVIEALVPNGNGNSSQLTGSDGNSTDNYLLVDDNPTVNDADYVGHATVGNKDTYTYTNLLASGSPTIHGIVVNSRVAKSDAGAISARRVIRTASTDYTGSDMALAGSATWEHEAVPLNPNTGVGWTLSGVNGIEVGLEVRT